MTALVVAVDAQLLFGLGILIVSLAALIPLAAYTYYRLTVASDSQEAERTALGMGLTLSHGAQRRLLTWNDVPVSVHLTYLNSAGLLADDHNNRGATTAVLRIAAWRAKQPPNPLVGTFESSLATYRVDPEMMGGHEGAAVPTETPRTITVDGVKIRVCTPALEDFDQILDGDLARRIVELSQGGLFRVGIGFTIYPNRTEARAAVPTWEPSRQRMKAALPIVAEITRRLEAIHR